jgi:hypothetical protein
VCGFCTRRGRFPDEVLGAGLVVVIVAGALCLKVWRACAKTVDEGHCGECGYNLAGLTSGICPECGRPACGRGEPPRPGLCS